jgi:predicted HTH domain antitoxin
MQFTVEIPDDLSKHADPVREALEAFAIASYRSGALTPRQTRELLGFETRFQLHDFLMQHEVYDNAYGIEDFRQDLKGLGL